MAPHMENQKQCSSKTEKIDIDLLEKLKLDEEREKKKLEKEAKRRAELEKFKNESLERQASLLIPIKKEKQTGQSKQIGLKSQTKKSTNKKQQSQNSQNKTNESSSSQASTFTSKPKSTASVTQQPYYESRARHYSTSSESSWKRDGYGKSRSSSRSESMWGDVNNHFPVLGVEAPPPQTNVWVERIIKKEENKALEPQSQYDEEAMLQRALALSMMEASKEQERQRKLEEECRLQMAALESNPKILEELDVTEEFIAAEEPDQRYQSNLKSDENYPAKSFSTNSALPGFNQKSNSSNTGGARPKLSKVIDSFGGWGLKTAPKDKYASKLSNFVDDIVNEEPSKETDNYGSRYQQNTFRNNVKKSEVDDPWDVSDTEAEKPGIPDLWPYGKDAENAPSILDPWRREVLYDGKGTFTDDDAKCDFTSSASDYNNIASSVRNPESLDVESPSSKLDKWLDSVDESAPVSNGWDDDVHDKKASSVTPLETRERDFNGGAGSFSSNNPETKFENSNISLSSFDTFDSTKKDISDNSSYRLNSNFHASSRTAESSKDTVSDMQRCREQNEFSENNVLTQFKNTYDYIIGSDGKTPNESNSVKTFQNDDVFSDKSSDKSASTTTFHPNPIESNHFQSDSVEGNGEFGAMISNEESSIPPILPPQPASAELVSGIKSQATEIPDIQDSENPAANVPPKAPAEMPPQFPPMFNPMFPAINPMLGLGLDPITMRQMLMLSNPFFASQLLAMEQYYRSLGMPVDLFSFPAQTVPNMPFPGLMGAPMGLSSFPGAANLGAPTPQLQSQSPDQRVPQPDNPMNDSCEKSSSKFQAPIEAKGDGNHIPKSFHNDEEDSWYSSLLTNDNASVIPPPKPASSLNTNTSCSSLTSDMTNLSQSASDFNSSERNHSTCGSSSLDSSHGKGQTPLPAVEAPKSKTDVTGWGDCVADSSELSRAKTRTWEDDGWGDDNLPAKSVKNPSVYEERRKVVHRQPARQPRQPQLNRFQNSRK